MKEDLQKLLRLIEVHSQLIERQSDQLNEFKESVTECERRRQNLHLSMTHYENGDIYSASNFSLKFRVVNDEEATLELEIERAKAEKKRLNAILDSLNERRFDLVQVKDEEDIVEATDEWLQSHARES